MDLKNINPDENNVKNLEKKTHNNKDDTKK